MDWHDVEAVIKILTETALGRVFLEIAVGGGYDADVDLDRLGSAHWHDLFVFQKGQQLDLHVRRKLADFVKKKGAMVGYLDQSKLARRFGASEGSFFISEQLGFQKTVGDGPAIDFDEPVNLSRAQVMNMICKKTFPRSRLPQKQ